MAPRALLDAALDGSLNKAKFRKDPVFGFDVPVSVLAIDRARTTLGWAPTTAFADGLRKMMTWMQAHMGVF